MTTCKQSQPPRGSASPLIVGAAAAKKSHGIEPVPLDVDAASESLPHIPTGSTVLDRLIGGIPNAKGVQPCPGMPRGKMMQLYGDEGAGKTTTALEIAASTCDSGGRVVYIDWEHEIVPDYAEALRVPVADAAQFLLYQPDTLEEGLGLAYSMAQAGVDLIIFDSVGAGIPQKALEGGLDAITEEEQIGELSRVWSRFLPRLKSMIGKSQTAVIGISQVREKITAGYGDKTGVQGGRAWKFFSAIRMRLTRIAQEKGNSTDRVTNKVEKVVVGSKVKAKLDKCKVSPHQGHEAVFYTRHGEGFDDIRSVIEVAIAHNAIKKSGAWLTWANPGGEEIKARGVEDFREQVLAQRTAVDVLYEQVEPFLLGTSAGGAA